MPHPLKKGAFAAAVVLVGALVVPTLTAGPADATTYPSWQDVERAKGNEAAKQAEIATVQTALQAAQADAAQKSQVAIDASAAADQAESDLADATRTATSLEDQAQQAEATAARAETRAGQLAANLYRDDTTGDMTGRIASAKNPSQLLYQLGALDQLSGTWAGVMNDAAVAGNTASALHAQADRAETARASLAAAAETKAAAARSAERAADAAVASTQQHTDELQAQLASLQDTTAETEHEYQVGQALRAAAVAEQQREAQAAAVDGNTSSNAYPSTGGVVVDPAGAQAYASSQLGAYGWGQDQMGCLVSLWTQESGWRANALNTSSGAYGIPQALPARKMANAGADWRTNYRTQVNWGLSYIKGAYGSPCAAWAHEMGVNPHWY